MNELLPSLDALLSDFTRPVVLQQLEVLLVAFAVWFVLTRLLELEQRTWPMEQRWRLLKALKPLTNELLLFVALSSAANGLQASTGVGGLALFISRFYGLCLLSRFIIVPLRLQLPRDIVNRFDMRVLRPFLALIGVAALISQIGNLNAIWSFVLVAFSKGSFTVGDLLLLLLGSYFLIAGTALPAWGLAWLGRRLFGLSETGYRAAALVMRYLIIAMGAVLILAYVGVNTTVLAAVGGGLSVGLGFGLKEVFSNFLSGVWLLLEGAVRPGDVLLLDAPDGEQDPCEVLELGMRATTLWRDRDNVELLVPNQTFFTQSMVTYNGMRDSRRRSEVVICVDHRQPPERVIQLLETTALTIPRVLNDPASRGLLLRYDASGLTYAIRYWIEDPMNGISIASELGSAAWHALDAAGIAIALPRLVLQNDARTQI